MKKAVLVALVILLGFFTNTSFAVQATVFGPVQYERTMGEPNVYTATFSASEVEGTLIVKNGTGEGEHRIVDALSSAIVTVNGGQIFGKADFSVVVHLLERPINLADDNSISVWMASAQGSYLTIEVTQENGIDPATVTISADPESIGVGQSTTLSWTSTNADYCTIEPGIGYADANGSIEVWPAETTTYIITTTGPGGTATDNVTVTVNHPPSITVTEPDGVDDTADTIFKIQWTDDDPDDNATISFYYDTDNSGADGTFIVSGLSEDLDGYGDDTYAWNTAEIGEGSYYVYAVIDDGINDPVVDYCDGVLTIDHNPIPSVEIKLTAGDAAELDRFGHSVSISGDYAIVGADNDDDGGENSGAAYIFKRENTIWIEQIKLTASNAAERDYFGHSVSISGDYAIVGAFGNDGYGSESGAAYIFKRDDDVWTEQAILRPTDAAAEDWFGHSVSISGDYAIVGASGDPIYSFTTSGAAYIFKREGTNWTQYARLFERTSSFEQAFAESVSISGDYAIVCSRRYFLWESSTNPVNSGVAYVFKREDTVWIKQAELTSFDLNETPRSVLDRFGNSACITGDYAVVGAYEDDDVENDSGAAYVFKRDGDAWAKQAKLTPTDAAAEDLFGHSVSISGEYIIVSALSDDDGGDNSGAAYIFKCDDPDWIQQSKLTASDGEEYDFFGCSVAIDAGYAIVGSLADDNNTGSAYIYSITTVNLGADPGSIQVGQSSTLSWLSTHADSCVIEPAIGTVDVNGSISVSPTETTTYTTTAMGLGGISADSVTVTVAYPPTVSINANPEILVPGQPSTLSWSSTNADTVVIDQGIGSVPVNGTMSVSPGETTTYTINATGPGGTATASVTVTVTYPPPTATMSADPGTILMGESSMLTWSTTLADSTSIDQGIGHVDLSGSIYVSPIETTTYTITAIGPGGSTTDSVTVTVLYPPTVEISANPETIMQNESSTLTWTSTNADSCVIEPNIGSVGVNGSIPVSPIETTTYTITASGPGGTDAVNVTVTVLTLITLEITSPSDGETIYRPDIIVKGTITNSEGNETGVTVNGMPTIVNGDQFVANHVPLEEGENVITAMAKDTEGYTASASITVYAQTTGDYIRLTADTESGVSPLEVTLSIEASFSFTDSSLTYTGPGEVESLDSTAYEYRVRMTTEGIYYFTAKVEDDQSNIYTDTVAIEVMDEAALDALLKAKWNGMKAALIDGDIQKALLYQYEGLRDKYEAIYNLLGSDLATKIQQMQDIELIYATGDRAKYRIKRDHNIDGQTVTITYYIYFSKNGSGLWQIERY